MTDEFEQRIITLAKEYPYPPRPLHRQRTSYRTNLVWRFATVFLLMLCTVSIAVPDVRATVLRWLNIGAVSIVLDTSEIDGRDLLLNDLVGTTTLDTVSEQLSFVPQIPIDNPPHRVFVQEDLLILVWLDGQQIYQVLFQTTEQSWRMVKTVEEVTETTVGDNFAYWVSLPHPVQFEHEGQIVREFTHFVEGHVLLWTTDGITYRLETRLPLSEAQAFAESLQRIDDNGE